MRLEEMEPEVLLNAVCERVGTDVRGNALDAILVLCRYVHSLDHTESEANESFNRIFAIATRAFGETVIPLIEYD